MVYVGAGAFNLVRRSAYEAMGTYAALRYDVIDDLNLGKLIKRAGFQQRMAMGLGLLRLRWIEGTMGMTQNLTKNAFAAFRYSVSITVLLMAAGVILNVLPFAAPLLPWPISQGYWVALAAILAFYLGMWWRVGTSPLLFVLHPVSFLIMSSAVVQSVGSTLRNGGVVWRGTRYPLEELRRRRA